MHGRILGDPPPIGEASIILMCEPGRVLYDQCQVRRWPRNGPLAKAVLPELPEVADRVDWTMRLI